MRNSGDVAKWTKYNEMGDAYFMDCNKMLQISIMEFSCLIHQVLRNAEAETKECYEMIYKLIYSPTFHSILMHFVN